MIPEDNMLKIFPLPLVPSKTDMFEVMQKKVCIASCFDIHQDFKCSQKHCLKIALAEKYSQYSRILVKFMSEFE